MLHNVFVLCRLPCTVAQGWCIDLYLCVYVCVCVCVCVNVRVCVCVSVGKSLSRLTARSSSIFMACLQSISWASLMDSTAHPLRQHLIKPANHLSAWLRQPIFICKPVIGRSWLCVCVWRVMEMKEMKETRSTDTCEGRPVIKRLCKRIIIRRSASSLGGNQRDPYSIRMTITMAA